MGDLVGLSGELGAGKTTLVRGLLNELGYKDDVRSPTFNLIQEFETDPPICHVDLYRLENPEQVIDLGLQDYSRTHATLVEWFERAGKLIEPNVTISLSFAGVGREAIIIGAEL
jgi:tRNA threonylcarbamoyladenosine biosynthesis protein TsaE